MKRYDRYLYDQIDREYDRKNKYLYEIATLQEQIEETNGKEKEQLKERLDKLVKNKSEHVYNKAFAEYKQKEKEFLSKKATKLDTDSSLPRLAKKLEVRLENAKQNVEFYKEYVELTYDAELLYRQAKMEIEQIPPIIEFARQAQDELTEALKAKKDLVNTVDNSFQEEFKKYKEQETKQAKRDIETLNKKFKDGLISKKAKSNTQKEINRKLKERITTKTFEDKKVYTNEIIKNKKHELSTGLKQKIRALDINVSDIRRVCPEEREQTAVWKSYVSVLTPGLGQLLNGQYIKALIMMFATLYTYIIAIPYALGFGNYRGEGVAGLIDLANNAGRLDRSIIFMIEGLVAIMLLVIAFVLLILAFKDANKVEKDRAKGVRVKSWCETRQTFLEDGFPYIVSMPALIVLMFIVFIPIMTAVLLSFTGMDPNSQAKFGWVGLENYKVIALGQGMAGEVFWKILGWTIVWTISATTLAVALGFILAIILNNDRIKGKALFRTIYLLPWAVPSFITILFFSILTSPNGAITQMLNESFGVTVSLKNDPFMARVTLILMQGWLGSAYVFLLSTGVLQSINQELYEAADIDGATTIKKLTKITVPMVLFQTAPLLVGQYTFNFNNFSIIYLFNEGGPFNPVEYGNLAGSTDLLISYIYKLTMENQYQALGAAITVVVSIGLMGVAYLGFRNTQAFKKEK